MSGWAILLQMKNVLLNKVLKFGFKIGNQIQFCIIGNTTRQNCQNNNN